jgi:ABC-type dipeptide/oligopeptide/nickel transport system permease component
MVFLSALLYIASYLVIDLLYGVIDPRVRLA